VMSNGFLLETGGSVRNKLPLQARLERLPTGLSVPEALTGARRDTRQ
jgi:hypothetical protein